MLYYADVPLEMSLENTKVNFNKITIKKNKKNKQQMSVRGPLQYQREGKNKVDSTRPQSIITPSTSDYNGGHHLCMSTMRYTEKHVKFVFQNATNDR